jgi:hypothetical protein
VTDRAEEFLDRWEVENVNAVAASDKAAEAERLARRCSEDAARAGISEQELEDAASTDVISYMLRALEDAAFREIEGAAKRDNESD